MDILALKERQRSSAEATAAAKTVGMGEIPVIDVGGIRPGASPDDLRRVADQVAEACETIGFFYAVNHGVPESTVAATFDAARRFFALPDEDRARVPLNRQHRGYMPLYHVKIPTYKANRVHSYEMAYDLPPDDPDIQAGKPLHGTNIWPDLEGFRPAMERYYAETCGFGFQLLRAFAVALGMPEDFFQKLYRSKPLASMRLLHYPPQVAAAEEFGQAPHSDYGILTILKQDEVGGLELFTRRGEWIAAPVLPGSFVINIGDLMSIWTNGRFTSMQHRVVNRAGRDRMSIPIFYNPSFDTVIECLPTCQSADNPPKYAPKVMGDYLLSNFKSAWESYKK